MNRPITDAGVAGLSLAEGRAELLEEILSLSTETAPEVEPTARRRWLLPAAGAVAAAVVIAGAIGLPRLLADGPDLVTEPPFAAPGKGTLAVLDQPGWELESATVQPGYGSLDYEKGDEQVEIRWKKADLHQQYVADRERIADPKVDPGEQVTLLGLPALLWAYDATDHTVIRRPDGDVFLEVRGSGMDRASFDALLTRLTAVAAADLDDHLPARFVTGAERDDAIGQALAGVPLPPGLAAGDIESTEADPYHLGADVAGAVVCGWIETFIEARDRGDAAGVERAQDALGTSRQWPVLRTMDAEGDYPEVVWEISAEVSRGRVPAEYQQGLGCD
ncbi:hypothetical protein CFH99_21070 [Nocardioides aromaticivorans]|uniref:Uncharacterized protein n=1 Tax=Nocardioides aromaticivorans TaxID=200618 RepID=A0ABX7PQ31_9ACTN|nr:hypothetical protein [Nocardioides aromaticivorans]QSR28116.1 hypothetical protein CFH99_21070 [Nocardioides aromaticivorans]